MKPDYQLSPQALIDLQEILVFQEERSGDDAASDTEERLLSAFAKLAETPGLGHRRSDLTPRPYFFYTLDPYFIVYARQIDPLPIIAVLHSSRNIRKLLKARTRK